MFGNASLAFLYLIWTQVSLGASAVRTRPRGEVMQMSVGPVECYLDDLIDLVEKQVRRELKPPPQGRFGTPEVDADSVGDDIGTPWTPKRWPDNLV